MRRPFLSAVLLGATVCGLAAGVLCLDRSSAAQAEKKRAAKAKEAEKVAPTAALPSLAADMQFDEGKWPPENSVSVLVRFGLQDTDPTSWDGRIASASGCRVLRVRPWRLDTKMTVDESAGSWTGGSWLGAEPRRTNFDVHLPDRPRPFVRPGVLVDLGINDARKASFSVSTAQGEFTVGVSELLAAEHATYLDGRASATLAVFARPVAVGSMSQAWAEGGPMWHDYPSVSVSPSDPNDVWFCYQSYCKDARGDQVLVRRRLGGQWQAPEVISPEVGDYYRTAISHDGKGNVWVVASAQIDGHWDLYGRRYSNGGWLEAVQLSENAEPDLHHVLVRATDGAVWLVWQSFRDGQSDIVARRWDGQEWGAEIRVSDSAANDWEPAAAALPDGGLAVAWDSYEHGQYDIFCRRVNSKGAGAIVRVTGSPDLEARASVACDRSGRLWIAYDIGGPNWGKDTGFWPEIRKTPEGTRLYQTRQIGLTVVDLAAGTLLARPTPTIQLPLDATLSEQIEYPHLLADQEGRLWMFFRRKADIDVMKRGVGWKFHWELYAMRFDPSSGRWTPPRLLTDSIGRLDMRPALALSADRIWAAWACNHRLFAGDRPDVCSVFAGSIDLAGVAAADVAKCAVQPAPPFPAAMPDPVHANEKADLARIRDYTIRCGEKTYHIYRGDMHRHTENSPDGSAEGSLLDAYRYSLDAAGMDFLLVSDHNDGQREYDWWQREKSNDLFRVGEAFVGLYGYERSVGYPNGHRNVFFTQRGVRPLPIIERSQPNALVVNSGEVLYPYLRQNGGICFGHTGATGMGTDWRDNDPLVEPLVEIFQGDRTSYESADAPWAADANDKATQEGGYRPLGFVDQALAKGYKLGFQSSSDHLSTHLSYSCILAERNTREALMDAMRQRHAYGATDNIVMDVRSQGVDGPKIMGDVFDSKGAPALRVNVIGTDRLREVVVIKDNRVVFSTKPDGATAEFTFTDADAVAGQESYYYVRAVQQNDRLAWASPMWITVK